MTTTAPGQLPAPARESPAPTRPRRAAGAAAFVGTGALLRLALRRDRVLLPIWVAGFALVPASSVAATMGLYPSAESLRLAAEAINNTAALVALYGKVYVTTSLGAISLIKMTAMGSAMVSILMVVLVVRHSRAEEETGRLELVAAGVVGRAAPLASALAVGVGTSAALGVVTAVSLGLTGLPWTGALAFGLGWALAGTVFSAVAAVTAQLTVSARAAIGWGLAAVGAAYGLRAVGDLAEGDPGVLSWLSPIGWSQQLRPFAGDRWWVAGIPLLATAVLVPTAFWLRAGRDLGSGLLPDRPGPAAGGLGTALALAWRLQRGMLLAWLVGAGLMGLVLGSVAHNVAGMLDSAQIRAVFEAIGGEHALVDMFLAAEIGLFGAFVSGYGIAATARLRAEESGGHAELLLSTATTRVRWAASHLVVALVGTAAVLVLAGAAIGLGHGLATDDLSQVGRLVAAAAAQVPAAWVMVSIAVLLFGWLPLAVPVGWGLLVVFVLLGEFGTLWEVPGWLLDLSPFAHSPKLPGGDVQVGQLALLLAAAALLGVAGLAGWRRRDLHA